MRITTAQLRELDRLLELAQNDDTLCARPVPTLRGKGNTRHGTGLVHARDAVYAELEARGEVAR